MSHLARNKDQAQLIAEQIAAEHAAKPSALPGEHDIAALNQKFADTDAESFLRVMIEEEFADRIALVSSFGAESAVLLDLVARVEPDLPVIFFGNRYALCPNTELPGSID